MVGPGKAIDTNKYRVICPSILGSPFGTFDRLSLTLSSVFFLCDDIILYSLLYYAIYILYVINTLYMPTIPCLLQSL